MTALLLDKNIVIYGAGGGMGRGIAETFARQGARLFLTGRTLAPLEAVAARVTAAGGVAHVAEVDALDERAAARSVDVSFNLIRRGDVQGTPLVDMAAADFLAPIAAGARTNFITGTAAARRMIEQRSGVIMTVTSGSSHGTAPNMGGTGPADAAVESLLRYLAAETGAHGVRVVGIWTAGVPETFPADKDDPETRRRGGLTAGDIEALMGPMTMLKRPPRLDQVAETAAFLASDRAAAITATITNATCGLVPW
jgi:NAD(P)-dependent dehydrogenase (short-subunit alcohol dehydrogenase family)